MHKRDEQDYCSSLFLESWEEAAVLQPTVLV